MCTLGHFLKTIIELLTTNGTRKKLILKQSISIVPSYPHFQYELMNIQSETMMHDSGNDLEFRVSPVSEQGAHMSFQVPQKIQF